MRVIRSVIAVILFTAMVVVSQAGVASAAAASATVAPTKAAAGVDSCGYDPSVNPVFSESTLVKAAAVYGTGNAAKIAVFSDDEWGTLLGIGATPMPATSAGAPAAHVSNPSLGNLGKLDDGGRPQYPALFITDQGTSMPAVPITTGDWQSGGSPVTQLQDVFGTWVTASYDANGDYVRGSLPAFKNTNGTWNLGPGSDLLPTTNSITSFVGTGKSSPANTEGYGSELRWDVSALGLTPGHFYRLQVMTHDGDQNKTGGDVGEACLTLEIPGPPTQHLVAHIYDCSTAATTTEVSGGTVSATGPTTVPSQANPMDNTSVTAGNYSVDAGAPPGYHFVACGGAATITSPTTATRDVIVPSGGTGTAIFYVAPNPLDPNLTIHKSASATQVTVGDVFDYTLDVANTGPGAATNAVVSDSIPAGLTIGAVTPSVGTCTTTGQNVRCALGNLAAHATASITIHVTTTTAACGKVTNTGTVQADNNSTVISNPVDVLVVCPNPALMITKSASAASVDAGESFDYTLVVTSIGGATATSVNVTDDIPAGLTIGGTPTTTSGTCAAPSGQHVSCNVGDLAAANANGGTKSATIVIHVTATTAACGTVTNKGRASASNVTTVDSNLVDVIVNCPISALLVKRNDADHDGIYHQAETAALPGIDVAFQATLTNTSAIPIVIDSISDAFGSTTISPTCVAAFVGQTLAAAQSLTCAFTLHGYSPAAGTSLEDTATVTGHDPKDPTKTTTAKSTSIVNTAAVPPLSMTVVKVNDANGDGAFSDDETGTSGASALFQAVITNGSSVTVVIDSITDVWPGAQAIDECAALIGTKLLPGASVTCSFSVANYVPAAADGAKVDTVTVKVHEDGNPDNSTSAADTSTVRGAAVLPTVLGETIVRAPLARTGADSTLGLAFGLLLIGAGSLLILAAQGSRHIALAMPATPVAYNIHPPIVDPNVNARTTRRLLGSVRRR